MLSFHKNYKICQHLNHQYDLNCAEILIAGMKSTNKLLVYFLFFWYMNFKKE